MQSSSRNLRLARLRRQALAWLSAGAVLFGLYRVYRWAEPSSSSIAAVLSPSPASSVSLELEEASFENFADGKKNWSLWAKRIALERQNGGVANSLQSATIDDIRDGKLFASPVGDKEKRRRGEEENEHRTPNTEHQLTAALNPQPSTLNQSGSDSDPGLPAATFTAQHGRYLVGSVEGLPAEMQFTYSVQWQFQLTGDVKIRTREGYYFHAPAIQVLELYNRKTGKAERHILCNQGGDITAKGATVHANQARYDEKNQTVECLSGVHAQLKRDSIQGEHFYWSLKNNMLRSPDSVSGIWQGSAYTAADIVLDANQNVYQGRKFDMQLNGKFASQLAAGSLGLVMAAGRVSGGQTPATKQSALPGSQMTAKSSEDDQGHFKSADIKLVDKTGIATGHNFTYIRGSRVITGDNGRYDKNNGVLDADGHLVMDDPEHHGTCQKAHVEEKKSLAVLTGDVVLVLKPQTSGASGTASDVSSGKKQGAVVTCDQVDSYYKKKFTVLRGHLVFKQHILREGQEPLDREGTAEHAEYDNKGEILTLFPPVQGHDSDESQFHADKDKVIIFTKAGEEELRVAYGEVVSRVKEDPDDDTTPPANPMATPPPDKTRAPGAPPEGGATPGTPAKPDANPTDTKKEADKSDPGKKEPGKPNTSK